ncbi:MAG TPA: hypothetical protein DIW17_01550 [Clostridiales bacterium]|nr:hypothetical protein [Clostridiales bacterium]
MFLSSCVPGDGKNTSDNPAGFLWGIWHGWLAPVSLILSLFRDNIRIYEVANTGFWYDFGFYISIISGFGGISLFRKTKRKKS